MTQVKQNLEALDTKSFTEDENLKIKNFYKEKVKDAIMGTY